MTEIQTLTERLLDHPKGVLALIKVQEAVIKHLESLPDDTDLADAYHLMIVRLHYLEMSADHFGLRQ